VDPVIRSSSGYALIDADAVRELQRRLFPLADVITPNTDESVLLGASSSVDAAEAARELYARISQGANGEARRAVLVTGGHRDGDPTDVLFDGQKVFEFHAERIVTRHTHGTGCTLSSAIAARLACGDALPQAVASAKRFVTEAIRTAPGLGQGAGPLNHLHHPINAPFSAVKNG
jgi:hydroxymethylpyrimidine/phosphomethylpyrimidine kinase